MTVNQIARWLHELDQTYITVTDTYLTETQRLRDACVASGPGPAARDYAERADGCALAMTAFEEGSRDVIADLVYEVSVMSPDKLAAAVEESQISRWAGPRDWDLALDFDRPTSAILAHCGALHDAMLTAADNGYRLALEARRAAGLHD